MIASEELEKIQAAAMMGAVAAMSETPVSVFVTMGALNAFETETVEQEAFAGGAVAEAMLTADDVDVPLFVEQFERAKTIGDLEVHACSMAMDLLDNDLDDYVDVFDDTLGVSGFLDRAADRQIIFV